MRLKFIRSGLMAVCLCLVACSLACLFAWPAAASLVIKVDKSAQTITVKRDGKVLHTWPVSTGMKGHATPSGTFTPFRMEAEHYSKEWDDAPMPHSVFFTKQGHAIHGSTHVKRLGMPASHGCVRLSPANAARLYALVKREGMENTRVELTGSERVALAQGKSRTANDRAPKGEAGFVANDTPSYPQPFSSSPWFMENGGRP